MIYLLLFMVSLPLVIHSEIKAEVLRGHIAKQACAEPDLSLLLHSAAYCIFEFSLQIAK